MSPFQAETANQLKFNFFPDIWAENIKDYNFDTVDHPFPGRKRREILTDKLTGQQYESYEGVVNQIADLPLNATFERKGANDNTIENEDDDEFDDQFEEDLLDKKLLEDLIQRQQDVKDDDEMSDDYDLSSSRWDAYDALSSMLERLVGNRRILRGH